MWETSCSLPYFPKPTNIYQHWLFLPAFEIHVHAIYFDVSFIQFYIWEIDAYLLNAINNPFISMLHCFQCVNVWFFLSLVLLMAFWVVASFYLLLIVPLQIFLSNLVYMHLFVNISTAHKHTIFYRYFSQSWFWYAW